MLIVKSAMLELKTRRGTCLAEQWDSCECLPPIDPYLPPEVLTNVKLHV